MVACVKDAEHVPPHIEVINGMCRSHMTPWPTIVVALVGAVFVIYSAMAPSISSNRRIFTAVFLALWTLAWALILLVLWRDCQAITTWCLMIVPVMLMLLFFLVIIVFNLGNPNL